MKKYFIKYLILILVLNIFSLNLKISANGQIPNGGFYYGINGEKIYNYDPNIKYKYNLRLGITIIAGLFGLSGIYLVKNAKSLSEYIYNKPNLRNNVFKGSKIVGNAANHVQDIFEKVEPICKNIKKGASFAKVFFQAVNN